MQGNVSHAIDLIVSQIGMLLAILEFKMSKRVIHQIITSRLLSQTIITL